VYQRKCNIRGTCILSYYVFVRAGFDRNYYCVAGHDIKHEDAVCYLFLNEAANVCTQKNMRLNDELRKEETLNESRGTSQGESSS
jgi:hypothetical protein